MNLKKKAKKGIARLLKILSQKEMLVLPGQLAFFLLLAMVPTFTLIAYGASFFHISLDFITNFLIKQFGSDIANLVMPIISEIHLSPSYLIPFIVALYTASGGASSLIVTSNELYHFEDKKFLNRKIKGIIMTFVLIILVIFLLIVPAFGDKVISLVKYVNLNQVVTNSIVKLIELSKSPISWLLIFMLIKLIFTMAPDGNIPSSCTTKGSLFTTLSIVVVTGIYSFYINHFANYGLLYGGLAQFVVLMIWFYLISYMIIIGVVINADEYQKKE